MILYRGFNNNYSKALGIKPEQKGIWMTEDYEYAKQYAEMFKNGAIAEIEVDDDYISLASEYDCFKIFGDDFDELGGDIEWDNEVCSVLKENGYDGMFFDDYGVYCYYIFNRDLIKGYKIVETLKNDKEDAMESTINNILKNAGAKQLNEREKINESIVYVSKKDLSDVILMNPSRKEILEYDNPVLKHQDWRIAKDNNGNYYFGSGYDWIHFEMCNTLKKQGIDIDVVFSDYDGVASYDSKTNTFYIRDEYGEPEIIEQEFNNSYIKNAFPNAKLEIDAEYDEMLESQNLNESIVYASKSDLSDVVLMNPSRKELRKNNMMFSRCMVDSDGCWYFCDMENMLHSNMESIFREDAFFPYYDGNDCYGIAYYDLENNEFWYNDNGDMTKQECENQYKQSDYLRSNFPNAKVVPNPYGWNDADYDLYESLESGNGFEIKDDSDDMFHKLTLLKNGYTKARCSYTNWGDWISIDWIESFGENKGYATQLLQYIKEQNPNIKEIGGEFVSKRIANLMKKIFGEPLKGSDPEADSYDDYLDDNDKSSCMTFKLNESVYFNDEVFNDWNDTYEQLKVLLNPSIEWLRNELNKPDCWGFRFLHNTEDNLLYVWDCHQSFMHQQVFDIIDPKWGKSGTNVIGIFEPEGISVWEEMADDGEAESSIKLAKKLDGKLFKELYPNGYEIGLCN